MTRASRVALAVLAAALLVSPLLTLHPAVTHAYQAGLSGIGAEASHPLAVVLVALATLSALPALGFVVSLAVTARSRGGLRALLEHSEPTSLGQIHYRLFPSQTIVLFTAGLIRPTIFVSSEAVHALSNAELHAALLHERAHQRNADVLWSVLLRAVDRAFGFLPHARRLVHRAALRTECEADEYAVRRGARRRDLFEAIAAASPAPGVPVSAGVSDGHVEVRLVRLVHPETPMPGEPAPGFLALSLAVGLPVLLAHGVSVVAALCTTNVA